MNTILIIDFEKEHAEKLDAILTKSGFFPRIIDESNKQDILNNKFDIIADQCPMLELILMDFRIHEISGTELCHQIKSNDRYKDIPIIIVTSQTDMDTIQLAFAAGAIDFIHKPVEEVELIARVRSILKLKHERDRRKAREKELLEATRQLEEANKILHKMTFVDGLTGIANRKYYNEYLEKEWGRAIREKQFISLLMVDIDFFKKFNDHYGHLAGDEALKKVGGALEKSMKRPADLVARYGGEEFVAVLPQTDSNGASIVAENILHSVEGLAIANNESEVSDVITASIGIATIIPGQEEKAEFLVNSADQALYSAKKNGRNKFILFER